MEEDDATPWHSDERMERYNSLFPILPEFVAHYTVGLKRGGTLDIGTEYAKRRYTEETDQSRWLGLTDRIDLIYEEARKYLSWYFSFQKDQIDGDELSYRDLSSQFFYRNLGSLDAAKRLAELGYLCEVATILRSALEQFAFCSRLSSLTGTEDLKAIRPIQCLNHFKKFVPGAGPLYGLMSKYTHFEFDHHTHFFAYSPTKNRTIRQGSVLRAYATQLLFTTMVCVSKYIAEITPVHAVPQSVNEIGIFIQNASR